MRIGIIAPPWAPVPPPAYGGTESVVDRLARGLDALGHDVVLFTTGDSTCAVERRWVYGQAQTHRLGNAMVGIRHVVAAYETMSEAGVDVVHDNTVIGPLYAWRYPALPVVTTNHGPFDEEFAALYHASDDRVSIVAISHHQASTACGLHVDAVIHHGIETDAFAAGRGNGGYVAFLGRMAPEKGAREAALVARRAGIPLLLAGKMHEQSEMEYFDSQVRPLLGRDAEYVGEIGHAEKVQLLGNAIALLNPIQWPEPFGLVMIEAMACGTPVLAFPVGAAPEIVDDGRTGFLCSDIDEMTARIDDVPALDRAACRAAVEQRFSTARMCEQYATLFSHVVGRSHSLR